MSPRVGQLATAVISETNDLADIIFTWISREETQRTLFKVIFQPPKRGQPNGWPQCVLCSEVQLYYDHADDNHYVNGTIAGSAI